MRGAIDDAELCVASNSSFAKGYFRLGKAHLAAAAADGAEDGGRREREAAVLATRAGLRRAPGDRALLGLLKRAGEEAARDGQPPVPP